MKFEDTEKKANDTVTFQQSDSHAAESHTGEMHTDSMENADTFQAELYNSGSALLKKLRQLDCVGEGAQSSFEELQRDLERLKNFQFNIGFAGGMSSGKSTVINSLIEYPLMPTCKLTTTCVGTHMYYGEHPRISVIDDDTGKQVLNVDCRNISKAHFQKLKEYACVTTKVKLIENLQHFTSHNLFHDKDSLEPDMLEMNHEDPNHVIILMMILLTVYVDQNNVEKSQKAIAANEKRIEVLNFFNFDLNTVNYTIKLQWNGDFLKSGMAITDLPGLGAYAPDKDMGKGKVMKGHDSISTDAVKSTDAMVFLVDPQVDGTGVPALQAMMSSTNLKESIAREDLIIPVLNKIDDCNGQSEIDQALEKFIDILKNTGLNKEIEDIHKYSAWYGEYKYAQVPDDRTCYYFRKYMEKREYILDDEEDLSEEELHTQIMEECRKELKRRYKKSGIQELKDFFRAAYINKSKNRCSHAAVLTMRALATEVISPMNSLLQNYEVLHNVAGDVVINISKNLKAQVDVPIANALEKIMEIDHKDDYVKDKLEDIPTAYSVAFRDALDEYKSRNLAIVNAFDLSFMGFSDNARIDQIGSSNYTNYQKLTGEMEKIGVDIKKINKKYSSILLHVSNEIERMYNDSLRVLCDLKRDIPRALDSYVESHKNTAGDSNDSVFQTIQALRNTLADYMEQQIDTIEGSMQLNQSMMKKTGEETVEKILDLNTEMVRLYTNSVVSEVRSACSRGAFFSSREYIKIAGSNGLKEIFSNLSLSSKDKEYIEGEVQSIGIERISNNLDVWYQDVENAINKNFMVLRKQMNHMMDDTMKMILDDATDIKEKQEVLRKKLVEVEFVLDSVRTQIQEHYSLSIEDVSDEVLCRYKDNILEGILDFDVEHHAEA